MAAPNITLLREIRYPHSLGMLYSTFTAYLGFAVNEDEYKVMGLAAYGRPTMTEEVRKLIRRTPDGAFVLDMDYFEYQTTAARSYSSRFVELFGPSAQPVRADRPRDRRRTPLRRLRRQRPAGARGHAGGHDARAASGDRACRICVSAAAWRSTASRMRGFSPSPASSACSSHPLLAMRAARSGAALYADRIYLGNPDRDVPDHPFWGPTVDGKELARAAREDDQVVEELDETVLIERIADELAAGRIVGWMEGASEFGPRALGHRSILAAPHSGEMRDRLNRDIKYREEFRPFAPVAPIEAADRYFELPPGGARLARFMSGVFPVRPEWRDRLAAITHVDGSARLQTLERDMAPRLHALLEAYGRRSGIPVLLNTSFNVAGEPIVNRALEGYSTFRRCGIDALVAGPDARHEARRRRQRDSEGGVSRDQETWRDAAAADHARQHRRVDRRSRSRVVAKRLRQAVAHTAGRLSLLVWSGADPGDDRRGAGAVHLRDLLTDGRRSGNCSPARPVRERSRADWSCRGCGARFEAPDGIPNLRLAGDARTDAVRRFYEHAPFPGYPPRDSLQALHARAERSVFARLVHQAIPGDARIVDIGCGTGQMCLYPRPRGPRGHRRRLDPRRARCSAPRRRGASDSLGCNSWRPTCGNRA